MKGNRMKLSRRRFLKRAAGSAAAIGFPTIIPSSVLGLDGSITPNNKIVAAGIGMGHRGSGDFSELVKQPGVVAAGVCDVKKPHLDKIKDRFTDKGIVATMDYREILAMDDVDVIVCGTPDHWHAQISIDAVIAGKDVYCEKPLTLTIAEGRKMVDAARRHNRIISGGSQRVLQDYGRMACAVRSGKYGKIIAKHVTTGGPPRQCDLPGEPVPDTIDWDMWLGPAPWAPYHRFRHGAGADYEGFNANGLRGYGFRSWADYSGGMVTDWGGHKFGAALHGLGLDHTGPVEIIPPHLSDNKFLTHVFENGVKIYHGGGDDYIGTEGVVKPMRILKVPAGLRWYKNGTKTLMEDFVYSLRTRKEPFRDVEYAHRTATLCHLTNICYKLKRKLRWDPVKEDFIGDLEASRMVDRPRRGPWQI